MPGGGKAVKRLLFFFSFFIAFLSLQRVICRLRTLSLIDYCPQSDDVRKFVVGSAVLFVFISCNSFSRCGEVKLIEASTPVARWVGQQRAPAFSYSPCAALWLGYDLLVAVPPVSYVRSVQRIKQ